MANDDYQGGWRLGEGLFPNQRPKSLLQSWWGATAAGPGNGDVSAPGIDTAPQGGVVDDVRSPGSGEGFYTGLTPYQPDTTLEPFRRLKAAQEALYDPRVTAMLATIRGREGRQYNVITGGQTFDDYSQHPNIRVGKSTAAGAYQFTRPTWTERQSALGLPDFSPASQDLAAADLLLGTGAARKLSAGDIDGAIFVMGQPWQAFPTTAETMIDEKGRGRGINFPKGGQKAPTNTLEQIRDDYLKNLR